MLVRRFEVRLAPVQRRVIAPGVSKSNLRLAMQSNEPFARFVVSFYSIQLFRLEHSDVIFSSNDQWDTTEDDWPLQSNQTFSLVASITRNYAAIIRNSERNELSFGAI